MSHKMPYTTLSKQIKKTEVRFDFSRLNLDTLLSANFASEIDLLTSFQEENDDINILDYV